jgi:tetratricopeptide (TPR) repeat protein/DNA-directed RNA polymerase subunit RPC12/RpoP
MIVIQCTSCKKALEVDETTLSNREPSVVRCPSCGVSLMVDKRKSTTPVVTGPVVNVVRDIHKPLLAAPSVDLLEHTGRFGEYVWIVASIYQTAETYLETNQVTRKRISELGLLERSGRDAIAGLALSFPLPSSRDEIREVQEMPDGRRLDTTLRTLSLYLARTHAIADLARTIWRDITSAHRYAPIKLWQTTARNTLQHANAAAITRTPDLDHNVTKLQMVAADYDALLKRHRDEHTALEKQSIAQQKTLEQLRVEENTATKHCEQLQEEAAANAWNAVKAMGCGSPIIAAIIATIVAISTRSAEVGWLVFFAAAGGILAIAHHVGSNKNEDARGSADSTSRNARFAVEAADRELAALREKLALHEAAGPELVAPSVNTQWSLLQNLDLDPDAQPQQVLSEETGAPRLIHVRNAPEYAADAGIPTVAAAVIAVSGSATRRPTVEGVSSSIPTRSVGFIAAHDSRAHDSRAAALSPDEMLPTFGELTTFLPAVPEPETIAPAVEIRQRPKRAIASAIVIAIIAMVASYFVWSANFSLHARLDKALASGQIFAPAGACVYDLYKTELARNPNSKVLAQSNAAIRSAIAPVAEESFARWYKDSDDTVSWPDLERTCEFLSILDPATKLHQMRKLYASAQQSIDAREYSKAITNYEEALKVDPAWVLALNGIGKVYMIERSPFYNERLGISYYQRACDADPNFTWAAKNLGDYHARKNNFLPAEQYLRRALSTSPDRPSILRALGNVCRKTRRPAEAMALYEHALQFEKDPDKVALLIKAMSAIRGGR